MNSEETLFPNNIRPERREEDKETISSWKLVTLGGVAGVLMGAGSMYTGQIIAKEFEPEEKTEGDSSSHTTDNGLKVAEVDQNQSFGRAFAAARAEVGPGGVFHWHGGIYNTYTAEEWNSMSRAEKNEFAQQVRPEIRPNEIPTPSDEHPDVAVHSIQKSSADDVRVVEEGAESSNQDDDVHIVGYTNVEGHLTVGLDMDGDGQADVAIIDVDDNQVVSNPDLVVDRAGNYATYGELAGTPDPNMSANNESPENPDESSVEAEYPLYDI